MTSKGSMASLAMREQEHRSPPETVMRTASDEPLPGSGPRTGRSAATTAACDVAGAGGGGHEEERRPEGLPAPVLVDVVMSPVFLSQHSFRFRATSTSTMTNKSSKPSLAMREQEHRSPPETVRTASDERLQQLLPGSGPRTARSAATTAAGDVAGGGGEEGRGPEGPPAPVLVDVVISPYWGLLMAAPKIQRRARSGRLHHAPPHGWFGFKLPIPAPPPSVRKRTTKKPPRAKRQRAHHALPPGSVSTAPLVGRPPMGPRQCVLCGVTETPQWRADPTGKGTLCNACGLRAVACALQEKEKEQLPPPATATAVISKQPPPLENSLPVSEPAANTQILKPMLNPGVRLLKTTSPRPRQKSPPPPTTTEPVPAPAPAEAMEKKKKKEEEIKRRRQLQNMLKECMRCGSTSTGQGTLCNTCQLLVAGGALQEQVHHPPPPPPPPPAPATTVISEQLPPQEIILPVSKSPASSQILEPMLAPGVQLLRITSPSPRQETSPPSPTEAEPASARAPAPALEKKRKKKEVEVKRWQLRKPSSKKCRLCNTSEHRPSTGAQQEQEQVHHHHHPPPAAAATTVIPEQPPPLEKKKKQTKWWQLRESSRKCLHCGSTSSPQFRTGPEGPSTLCNPCGVRYRQGALYPEYRPHDSPSFDPSKHAFLLREVLKRRNQSKKATQLAAAPQPHMEKHQAPQPAAAQPQAGAGMEMEQHTHQAPQPVVAQPHTGADIEENLPPPPAQQHGGDDLLMDEPIPPLELFLLDGPPALEMADGGGGDLRMGEPIPPLEPSLLDGGSAPQIVGGGGGGDDLQMGVTSSLLDPFLLNGPAAPMLIDDDDEALVD